jgi:hypothetical protein
VPKVAIIHFAEPAKASILFASMDAALKWARLNGSRYFFRIEEIQPTSESEVAEEN